MTNIELNSTAERMALEAMALTSFKGFDLKTAKEKLSRMLNQIGRHGLFSEYTKHDISHVDGMLSLLDLIIPDDVKSIMTATDWLMLVLSCYFHDLGMVITNEEYESREKDEKYNNYKEQYVIRKTQETILKEKKEKYLYQGYIREFHGKRIEAILCDVANDKESNNAVFKILDEILKPIDKDFIKDLAKICRSHSEPFNIMENESTDQQYEQNVQSRVNLVYIAALLRTADVLHVNSERTPEIEYLLISPQNSYSKREWVKQKSVKCIRIFTERDKDGNVSRQIPPHQFEVVAKFTDEEAYSSFMDYLGYAEDEIKVTHKICKYLCEKNDNKYVYPWDAINRESISVEGFCAERLSFELDKQNILKLLIGHTLYNQANVVLRELVQNAIDACRLMEQNISPGSNSYTPQVQIEWNPESRELKVSDNGTGMDENIIRNYFLKVGASRYQSEEFRKEHKNFHSISRFGIGLLTCFMISDDFEITTLYYREEQAHKMKIKGAQGQYIMRNDAGYDDILGNHHGTTFVVKVHDNADMTDILSDLRKWIVVPKCRVTFKDGNSQPVLIGYESGKDALIRYLEKTKIKPDGTNYKIDSLSDECNGFVFWFLLKRDSIYSDCWNLCKPYNDILNDMESPIGICIEGIKVLRSTPGFDVRNYFGLINCTGYKSPHTNVARDGIEQSDEEQKLFEFIYNSYLKITEKQIPKIRDKYTLQWALDINRKHIDDIANNDNFYNKKLFDNCLHSFKCNLVDRNRKYEMVSIKELGDKVWTIESQAYTSAENLIRDIKSCPKTALALFEELIPEFKKDERIVFTNKSSNSYVRNLFLKYYEVSEIVVHEETRIIEYCWIPKDEIWQCVQDSQLSFRHRIYNNNLFILKDTNKLRITDGNANIYVSNFGLFMLDNHPLHNYFMANLNASNTDKVHALEIVVRYLYRLKDMQGIYDEKKFSAFFRGNDNYMGDNIWKYLDEDSLRNALSQSLIFLDFNKYYSM